MSIASGYLKKNLYDTNVQFFKNIKSKTYDSDLSNIVCTEKKFFLNGCTLLKQHVALDMIQHVK